MAHIMDIADGTVHPVEEPSYRLRRDPGTEFRDAAQLTEHPQLQLAVVESQTHTKPPALPATSVEALIRMLED